MLSHGGLQASREQQSVKGWLSKQGRQRTVNQEQRISAAVQPTIASEVEKERKDVPEARTLPSRGLDVNQ